MPLPPGSRLGRYQVQSLLAAGGMGELYRATDLELKRDVAIKVLQEAVDSSADRVRRFRQEALATASLSHPHIVSVYDAGTEGSTGFVVVELLDGSDLRHLLAQGPLKLTRALQYAMQIASGLAAIHGKGIIHRDLKPENIFVTRDGRVKILDFGIARVVDEDAKPIGDQVTATVPGTMIGTAGYMSPEQVRGETVDYRSDIFAFGAVLYEMLTGGRAFKRNTAVETAAAILSDDPPAWAGDGTSVSRRLLLLALRCMAKAPTERFQSAHDLQIVLSDQEAESAESLASPPPPRRVSVALAAAAGAIGLAIGLVIATMWWGRATPDAVPTGPPVTITLSLPPGESWSAISAGVPQISRDGRRVAAMMTRDGIRRVQVMNLSTGVWRAIPGTEETRLGFFSPDGSEVTFVQGDALMRIPIEGGAAAKICDCGLAMRGGDWFSDGRIVMGLVGKGLAVVPSTGGTPSIVTTPNAASDEGDHRYPIWSPDGKTILFTVQDVNAAAMGVASIQPGSPNHTIIVPQGKSPQLIDGNLVYTSQDEEVRAVAFDAATGTVAAQSFVLSERPSTGERVGDVALRASSSAVLWVPARNPRRYLDLVDRRGSRQRLPLTARDVQSIAVSPTGQRIALAVGARGQNVDLWLYDIAGDALVQLTSSRNSRFPVWVDDHRIMFERRGAVSKAFELTLDAAGRSNGSERLLVGTSNYPSFSDGQFVVYGAISNDEVDIHRGRSGDPSSMQVLLERPRNQWGTVLSPDGKWIAYISDELSANAYDLFVSPYVAPLRPRRLIPGATHIRWSRTSNELFFNRGGGLFAATVDAAGSLRGEPRRIADVSLAESSAAVPLYDTMPDGRLLIAVAEPEAAGAQSPVLVLNWASRVREAATKK